MHETKRPWDIGACEWEGILARREHTVLEDFAQSERLGAALLEELGLDACAEAAE